MTKKFDLTVYSFHEVEPVSLEDVKGGIFGFCCLKNTACNKNTDEVVDDDGKGTPAKP